MVTMLQIKKIRKQYNITQQQLADASGLNIRWIQKIESGETNLENITLKNASLLLKGLSNLIPNGDVSDDFSTLRSAYVVVRELLKEE